MAGSHHQSFVNRRILRVNVGFLLAEGAGYQRVIDFDLPRVRLDNDLDVDFLKGSLRLSRNSRGILVQGKLETDVLTDCARCLTPVFFPVVFDIEELFSYPPSTSTVYSVEETGFLDLAPLVREEAILAVPMGVLCRPDCAGLCAQCGQNLNEGNCNCQHDTIDPRLAILRTHLEPDDHPDQ